MKIFPNKQKFKGGQQDRRNERIPGLKGGAGAGEQSAHPRDSEKVQLCE